MNELIGNAGTGITRNRLAGWLPHILAVGGLILAIFDSRFLFVAAAGFFGPGILAELGIVRLEEFRQETSRGAAHQAFLVAGFVALIHGAATVTRWRPRIAAALVVAAMVWMLVLSGAWRLVSTSNGFPWEISFEIVIYFLLLPGTAVLALVFGGQESE